jgi:hypothetical protein
MQKGAYNVAGAVDYIFMTEQAWIVAQIRSGEVLAWSVTVTDKRFKIDLRNLTGSMKDSACCAVGLGYCCLEQRQANNADDGKCDKSDGLVHGFLRFGGLCALD